MTNDTITIEVPKSALVDAFLEKVARSAPAPKLPAGFYGDAFLPAIGEPFQDNGVDGIYAGLTLHDNAPMALVLLPGDEKLNWKDAIAWAAKQGGELPSRVDHLVLLKNLKAEFKDTWYWSSETYASHADYAWCQNFGSGFQYGDR